MEVIRGHLGRSLSGGCPLFGGSAIGGSTVYTVVFDKGDEIHYLKLT